MSEIQKNYYDILTSLKEKIRNARIKAAIFVNLQLLSTYWEIGNAISEQEYQAGWGKKIVERLAADLKTEFPDMKGLSPRNLRYMREFAIEYPQFLILQDSVAKLKISENEEAVILQRFVAKLPWGHNCTLLDKVKLSAEKLFYATKAVQNGWTRDMLINQIENGLHKQVGSLSNNFALTLPSYDSELALQLFKDPYNFDFLQIGEEAKERDLENALIQHITKMLLELGDGFAFKGRQYKLDAGGKEYFVDLLFYHTRLRRHIVIELKIGEFLPEYISKMNLYLGLIDDNLKTEFDEPAIGLILCKTNNKIIAEYALRDTSKPIGIAEYKIAAILPENIKGELPTIEELEQELEKEIKILQRPIDEKKNKLNEILKKIKGDEVKKIRDKESLLYIFNEVLWKIKQYAESILKDIMPMFTEARIDRSINGSSLYNATSADLEARFFKENVMNVGLILHMEGFKSVGTKAFGIFTDLYIGTEKYKYGIGKTRDSIWQEYLYDHEWTEQQLKDMAEKWCEIIVDEINFHLQKIL
jgi:predicted nuclease of restriction endonuclease-like (RecB) superfamily